MQEVIIVVRVRIEDVADLYQTALCNKIPIIDFELTNDMRIRQKPFRSFERDPLQNYYSRGIIFKVPFLERLTIQHALIFRELWAEGRFWLSDTIAEQECFQAYPQVRPSLSNSGGQVKLLV